MDAFRQYFSIGASLFSAILTVYFWFVKARRERPSLMTYVVDREMFLGNGDAQHRQVGLKLGLVVANYSSLPNAVLDVQVAVQQRDGQWLSAEGVSFDQQTPPPFNVPALQTVLVRVASRLRFPHNPALEQEKNVAKAYSAHHLSEPRMVRLELKALNDQIFTATLPYDARA